MTVALKSIEQLQQRHTDSHRVHARFNERPRFHLVDDAVREENLILVTACLDDDRVRKGAEKAGDQVDLPEPASPWRWSTCG